MTEKQQRILDAALRLFATEGYDATSTSKVAKEAEVSEGLIFRHFGNKEGLLGAIMEQVQQSAKTMMASVIDAKDPRETIARFLEVPFSIQEDQYEMWRLIYSLKWQTHQYDTTLQETVKFVLKDAFESLEYDDPEAEVELLFMFLDGAAISFLLHEPKEKEKILQILLKKYNL
jgi:AcrR family transcriptional regulator